MEASVVATVALVVSGLALVGAELVLPDRLIPDEPVAALVAIQTDMQAYMLSKLIGLVFILLMPVGPVGVAALAHQRRAWVAYGDSCDGNSHSLFVPPMFIMNLVALILLAAFLTGVGLGLIRHTQIEAATS